MPGLQTDIDSAQVEALRLLLKPPDYGNCDCCEADSGLDGDWLAELLRAHGSIQAAAYAGCIMLAENSGVRLSDGTTLPDRQNYWLRLARLYRPSGGRCIGRADELPPPIPSEEEAAQ